MHAAILLLLWPGTAHAAEPTSTLLTDLPPWQTFAMVDELTPEMRWYRVDYDDVERCSCEVGVPLDETLEPRLRCWFPGVDAQQRAPIPRDAVAGARQARRAVRRSSREDDGRASRLDVHFVGTWRKVLLRDVVLRVPGPPESAIFTSTRAAFRVEPSGSLTLLDGGPLGEAEGGCGLLCYGGDCTSDGLLDWAPPPQLDGASLLSGLIWEPDARARAAWPELERAALDAITAMDQGRGVPAEPPNRQGPGLGSTGATWGASAYGTAPDGTRVSQSVALPLDLAQAQEAPVTIHRRLDRLAVQLCARFDLAQQQVTLIASGLGGQAGATWALPSLELAPHGALPGSTTFGIHHRDLQLFIGTEGDPGSLMIAADPSIHPSSLAPIPAGVRLPVAGERHGDRVVWTAWEWLDSGPSRVLGLRLEVCTPGDRDACSGLLQGGAEAPADFGIDLPPGPLDVSLEVFDTDIPPGHLWQPANGDYHSLWSATFTAAPVTTPEP